MSAPLATRPQAGHGVPNEAAFGVSQVIIADGAAWVAGQIARDPAGNPSESTDLGSQTRHALANLGAILDKVALELADVLWLEAFVVSHDPGLERELRAHLDLTRLAGVVVPVAGLYAPPFRIEITTMADARRPPMEREVLPPPDGGSFARAVRAGPRIMVGGCTGVGPSRSGDAAEQFANALDELLSRVAALGGTPDDVVSTHIYTSRPLTVEELEGVAESHRVRFTGANRPTANLIVAAGLTDSKAVVEVCGTAVLERALPGGGPEENFGPRGL